MSTIKIKAFADQQADRNALMKLADRATVDLLILMDLVTTQGEGVEVMESAAAGDDAAAEYLEFRSFFGPRIKQGVLVAMGQAFAAASVNAGGMVTIDDSAPVRHHSGRASLVGRLAWIASELPHLETHGELYPAELTEARRLTAQILALDIDDREGAQAIWPRAEELYKWSQRGARISRGDEDAVAAAREVLAGWAADLEREEATARHRIALATGASEPRDVDDLEVAIEAAGERVDELSGQIRATRRRLQELTGLSNDASERLTDLLARR